MPRPKSKTPPKGQIHLSATEQTRMELAYVAAAEGKSISELVADWATKAAKKISKETGKPLPDPQQLKLDV